MSRRFGLPSLAKKVALIEREHLGGICLNWGCIPTKALLRAAELHHHISQASAFGIEIDGKIKLNPEKLVQRSREVAQKLAGGVAHLLKKNKITVIEGEAKLAGKQEGVWSVAVHEGKVKGKIVAEKHYSAPHIIIATGARPRQLSGLETDGTQILSYKEAMVPAELPRALIIVGSGAIGVEFASFYRDMGTEVTIIESLPRILNAEDEEISALAHKAFTARGIKIHTSAQLQKFEKTAKAITAHVQIDGTKQKFTADRVIMAVGIVGNIENLGLETTKIQIDKGHIITDAMMRTSEAGLYAIGDVTAPPWLAHKASHEGMICVEAIFGQNPSPLDVQKIPGCTYCRPQIASVGLTEAQAIDKGQKIKIGKFPFMGNGKAIALGDEEGLVKVIFDEKTGALLGAHLIGPEVTELIQGYVIAQNLETTEAELIHSIFPHPTLSEAMHESVLDAYGRVVHV